MIRGLPHGVLAEMEDAGRQDRISFAFEQYLSHVFERARATARHVKSLYVAGREIVRDGRVLGVDLPAIEREVIAQARRHAERMRGLKPVLERSQATLKRFYVGGGHCGDRRIS